MDDEYRRQIDEHEKRISAIEQKLNSIPKNEIPIKKISIKELMIEKKPSDDIQKTLLIGYYMEKYSGATDFTSKDLKEGFASAKESIPDNISDKIAKNVRKGHMMELPRKPDGTRAITLTNTGENFVENGFK